MPALRRLWPVPAALLLALGLSYCQVSLALPDNKLKDMARDLLAVAHPTVTFKEARLVGGSPGGCLSGADPYVDVEITYRRALGLKDHTLNTRLHVQSVKPCQVSPEVLNDTGPVPPVLLAESLLGPSVGESLCEQLR